MNSYYVNLGKNLREYLDDNITFEELLDKDSLKNESKELREDETIKLIWHAVFQYKNDLDCNDDEYVHGVKYWLREISSQLVECNPNVRKSIDRNFNAPMSEK